MSSKSLFERYNGSMLDILSLYVGLAFVFLVAFKPIGVSTIAVGILAIGLLIFTSIQRLKRKEGKSDGA